MTTTRQHTEGLSGNEDGLQGRRLQGNTVYDINLLWEQDHAKRLGIYPNAAIYLLVLDGRVVSFVILNDDSLPGGS